MPAYLALDQGTTSSRAIVYDIEGRVLGDAQHEFAQHFPQPGWVEHDAVEIWETQWRAVEQAHAAAGQPPIEAVGITNQRETVVVFDRATGAPIHRALVWQDRRTAGKLRQLARHADEVLTRTGLPLDPYFSAAKIAWILDSVQGARQRAEAGELGAATMDSWLLYKLTGGTVFATEPSNAARTSLFDIASGDWDDDLLRWFEVPRACLPEVRPTAGHFGDVAARGWPVTAMIGDQQSALFGQGCTERGSAKCTYGTGAFLLSNAGSAMPVPRRGLLATVAWRLGDTTTYALEGSVMICGALIQWLRDGLRIIDSASEVEALANSVADTGGLVIVPAFAGLGTPHWDSEARGLMIGITRGTGRGHVARAALEAMALQVCDLQSAMSAGTGAVSRGLRVDGGAAANDLLMRLQAALSGVAVTRPGNLETTALGAARMAMVGAGAVATPTDLPPPHGGDTTFAPEPDLLDRDATMARWRAAVERSKGWTGV